MAKDTPARHVPKSRPPKPEATTADPKIRLARLVAIIDQCTAAKETAEGLEEKFLAYMLSMAIQEARTRMRQGGLAEAASEF